MKSNYKKLGQFIQQVSIKNSDLRVDNLLGVSITKEFIKSIANTIGTDMTTYKIVKKNQFTYGSITSRNGDKISIALLQEDEAIVSTSYTVFEITNTNELLPEYLMMWFRRPEFDRYARYMSHGSTREAFGWEEMCDVELPVPTLEKQKEIIKEYHTIIDRIKLNEQLNQKLEDTVQSIFKEWFVNFEFPDENGKPYKSNGGKMEYSQYLDKEVPLNSNIDTISELIEDTLGGDWKKKKKEGNYTNKVLCIRGTDIPNIKTGIFSSMPSRYILDKNLSSKKINSNDIVIEISGGSPIQSTGRTVLITSKHIENAKCNLISSNFCKVISIKKSSFAYYLYNHMNYLYNMDYMFMYENSTTGVKNFNLEHFLIQEYIYIPSETTVLQFNQYISSILDLIVSNGLEIESLNQLKILLLSKMTIIEDL
mgnify:CR=1 FL=1